VTTTVDNYKLRVSQTGAKQTETAMNRLAKSLNNIAFAYIGYRAAKGIITLTAEQDMAEKRLIATTQRLGATSDAYAKSLMRQASALQRVSVYGDEAIMATQTMLLDLGASPDKMDSVTKATIELASALRMDLSSAARLMGQALSGNVQTLARYLPKVRDLTEAQIANGEVVGMIIKQFGGSAAAEANTLTGAIKQATMATGDLVQAFGKESGLAWATQQAATGIADLARELERMSSGDWMLVLADVLEVGGNVGLVAGGRGLADSLRSHGKSVQKRKAQERGAEGSVTAPGAGALKSLGIGTGGAGGKAQAAEANFKLQWTSENVQAYVDAWEEGDTRRRENAFREYYEGAIEEATARDAAIEKRIEGEEYVAEAKRRLHKETIEMAEREKNNAMDMAISVSGAASSMAQSLGSLVQNIAGQNSAAAEKAQKFMLFISGAAAVTEGVVAILKAKANAMTSYGASLAQIPFGIALMAKGAIMMGGSFLTSGDSSGGGGGSGIGGFQHYGGMGQQAGGQRSVVINVNSGIVHDEGGLGKTIQGALDRAALEGRI